MSGDGSVLLVGGGRMGGALMRGWSGRERMFLFDPHIDEATGATKIDRFDPAALPSPLTVIVAVKPQILAGILADLRPFADAGCLFMSIVAGATLAGFAGALGDGARVVRCMPNTPAAVLRGITAAVAAPSVDDAGRERATALLGAVGELLWLDDEALLDAVTAMSGSGPAYFFRFTEALARAGVAAGLPAEAAMQLARATFTGAAALVEARPDPLATLRTEVTSPGGTTAAALGELDRGDALDRLVDAACAAAAARSRALAS